MLVLLHKLPLALPVVRYDYNGGIKYREWYLLILFWKKGNKLVP